MHHRQSIPKHDDAGEVARIQNVAPASEHTIAASRATVSAAELLLWLPRNSSVILPLASQLYVHV
jgi:hypothetical protein